MFQITAYLDTLRYNKNRLPSSVMVGAIGYKLFDIKTLGVAIKAIPRF